MTSETKPTERELSPLVRKARSADETQDGYNENMDTAQVKAEPVDPDLFSPVHKQKTPQNARGEELDESAKKVSKTSQLEPLSSSGIEQDLHISEKLANEDRLGKDFGAIIGGKRPKYGDPVRDFKQDLADATATAAASTSGIKEEASFDMHIGDVLGSASNSLDEWSEMPQVGIRGGRAKQQSESDGENVPDIPDIVHKYRVLVARHIEKVRSVYAHEIRPVFSWLYDELPKINTLERYIASDKLPDDLKPICGLLMAKSYGDLVLEWIQKQVPLHMKWKCQLFNEDQFDPRQELFDMIANFFASTALSYMKVCMANNNNHPKRSEMECNDFMLQVLRCLSYMDKPELLKSLEDASSGKKGSLAASFLGDLSSKLGKLKIDENKAAGASTAGSRPNYMDEPDENLPDFAEFYGYREVALIQKVWEDNAALLEFRINPEQLLTEMADDEFPSSEYLITKISDVLDVLVEMINFELYTTHDRTFLLNAFAAKELATPQVVSVVCGRYEDENSSVLELWEGIFARVYQTLYPDDAEASSDEESSAAEDFNEQDSDE